MSEPSKLLRKLSRQLFADSAEQSKFMAALTAPQPYPAAILWARSRPQSSPFEALTPLTWQPPFVDRLAPESQPGRHPLHQAGAFYCLDFSSVFAASVLLAIATPVRTVLDVCAAPGGKSLFGWVALQPQQLLSNEVIHKRVRILIANLKRCGAVGAIALSLDPAKLAQEMPQAADLVLVDAPCSGQSLLAKGDKALGCFHPVTINKNANRQKRILAEAAKTVAPQGYLAYMTCTYAAAENERVGEWLLERFPQFQPVAVPPLAAYQSKLTSLPCYRLWPQRGLGAGAFTLLLQNTESGAARPVASDFLSQQGRIIYPA
ncbi:RsmB/NOP family class I SAM-dependent RNA methyltransferase [Sphaerothrix gracilis]|uniref:RsmB/NOP family class I SAM-dependent RNA methyltransferase n=1 Tax=Sphaerothrix gracilis TaxID=3151835 RepID=UPI0031FBCF52